MKRNGFTLIELMVVVVIVGILAAIAYPNYVRHIQAGRRAEAKEDLTELAQFMERYNTERNTYVGAVLPPVDASHTHYTISFTVQTADAFTLQATPDTAQSADQCGTLSLNQQGVKTAALTTGCW